MKKPVAPKKPTLKRKRLIKPRPPAKWKSTKNGAMWKTYVDGVSVLKTELEQHFTKSEQGFLQISDIVKVKLENGYIHIVYLNPDYNSKKAEYDKRLKQYEKDKKEREAQEHQLEIDMKNYEIERARYEICLAEYEREQAQKKLAKLKRGS